MSSVWTQTANRPKLSPLEGKHGGYYVKLYQSRSYVLALETVPKMGGMM